MLLRDILYKVAIEQVKGLTDLDVAKIEFDSRKVEEGDAFVAIHGTLSDDKSWGNLCCM
jgi:UDP-N-acetylmuramoyl-L-alanyl-D-glutamate--2,6-diaminopimelate ligase